eukprot:GHVU01162406.1.p1 GENE.GHVU01162406.1~~GHVU01162406.1.p1  ORF type:complete len:398 (+),score=60.32 GHVU01162406.1:71-1195(+)
MRFQSMDLVEDDVVLTALPFGGTIWVHKILTNMLKVIDDEGSRREIDEGPGTVATMFVEAMPNSPVQPMTHDYAGMSEEAEVMEAARRKMFGGPTGAWNFDHLLQQARPRLFSTHLYGEMLPAQLTAASGKGKLVVAVRNLKDVLVSSHFFRGEPSDGWLGNQHGAGSFARFVDPSTPNAYGSMFTWVKQMDGIVQALQPSGRVLVVQYEELVIDLPKQVQRIATFLGHGTLTTAKLDSVVRASSFLAFGEPRYHCAVHEINDMSLSNVLSPKGGVRDWCHHLTKEKWEEFDVIFSQLLSRDCQLAAGLCAYQKWDPPLEMEAMDATMDAVDVDSIDSTDDRIRVDEVEGGRGGDGGGRRGGVRGGVVKKAGFK